MSEQEGTPMVKVEFERKLSALTCAYVSEVAEAVLNFDLEARKLLMEGRGDGLTDGAMGTLLASASDTATDELNRLSRLWGLADE